MFIWFFFSYFLYKRICCGYSFELFISQVDAIQMNTHYICFCEENQKKKKTSNKSFADLLFIYFFFEMYP